MGAGQALGSITGAGQHPYGGKMRHVLGEPCPVVNDGDPVAVSFTDHERPGVFNACDQCHDDKRTVGQRLADLERSLEEAECLDTA